MARDTQVGGRGRVSAVFLRAEGARGGDGAGRLPRRRALEQAVRTLAAMDASLKEALSVPEASPRACAGLELAGWRVRADVRRECAGWFLERSQRGGDWACVSYPSTLWLAARIVREARLRAGEGELALDEAVALAGSYDGEFTERWRGATCAGGRES